MKTSFAPPTLLVASNVEGAKSCLSFLESEGSSTAVLNSIATSAFVHTKDFTTTASFKAALQVWLDLFRSYPDVLTVINKRCAQDTGPYLQAHLDRFYGDLKELTDYKVSKVDMCEQTVWVDFVDSELVAIMHQNKGFGLYTSEDNVFGEGPDEVYKTAQEAAAAAETFLTHEKAIKKV